jgi:predicted NUDIX family phosphoesterase
MKNDLDKIDPIVEEIYKYKHGTKEFEHNRCKVFIERNLFDRYDELIYYTELHLDNEIVDLDDDMLDDIKIEIANRNTLEYNGDKKKQLVVAAIVYDRKTKEYILLKNKGERLNGKLTMVQGHMAVEYDESVDVEYAIHDTVSILTDNYKIARCNLLKELEEEINLSEESIDFIDFMYLLSANDNKISSEHMGIISIVEINGVEVTSGEPDKNDVVRMNEEELLKEENIYKMDSWLQKIVMKLKEEKEEHLSKIDSWLQKDNSL